MINGIEYQETAFLEQLGEYLVCFDAENQQNIFHQDVVKPLFNAFHLLLAKSEQDLTAKIICILKLIVPSLSQDIIGDILLSEVPKDLIVLVLATEKIPENGNKVADIFKILANIYYSHEKNCELLIQKQLDQLFKVMIDWKSSHQVSKGFAQFIFALTSAGCHSLRTILTSEYIQILIEITNQAIEGMERQGSNNFLLDCISIWESITDLRQGDNQTFFAHIMSDLLDRGIYKFLLMILLSHPRLGLRVLAARMIRSASSIEGSPEIEVVSSTYKKLMALLSPEDRIKLSELAKDEESVLSSEVVVILENLPERNVGLN